MMESSTQIMAGSEEEHTGLINETENMEESDTSDDSSSEESEEETLDMQNKIASLQSEIDANPYLYDRHVQLINAIQKTKDSRSAQLKAARERMSSLFPLTEELWLDWLKDEQDYEVLSELFEKAITDYASVEIWMEYIYHLMRKMTEPDSIESIRKKFELAIKAVGLNVASGGRVWAAYREFETAVAFGLKQPSDASRGTKDEEDQMNRITKLYKRVLSVPLKDMESTFQEYKDILDGEVDVQTQRNYEKAIALLRKLRPYEEALTQTDPPHLEAYNKYIEFEMSNRDAGRIRCIFERAIRENCLVPDLWLRYVEFLHEEKLPDDLILAVYRRSIRNCPWVAELWVGLLMALEASARPHLEIKATFSEALGAGFTQGSEYFALWSAYIDFLRRQVDWKSDHSSQLRDLRDAFERAIDELYQRFSLDGDPRCSLSRSWAFIEAKYCHNMSKARELWSQIMDSGFSGESAMWIEFIQLERSFGDLKHCRKVLQRALKSVQDWPEGICEAFLRFEREEGDFMHFQMASSLCKSKMKELDEKRAEEARKLEKLSEKKKTKKPVKQQQPFGDSQGQAAGPDKSSELLEPLRPYQRSKRSQQKPLADQPRKFEQQNDSVSSAVVYVRGAQNKRKLDETCLPPPIPEEAALVLDKEGFKIPPPPMLGEVCGSTHPPQGILGKSSQSGNLPPGYPIVSSDEPQAKRMKVSSESQMHETAAEPPARKTKGEDFLSGGNNCTVFVSNLDYSVTQDHVKEIFSKAGEVKEVRLVMNPKTQHSKGFAYIDFIDELAVGKALKLDRTAVDGRPMYVSEYDTSGANRSSKFKSKFEVGLEKNKLFVKGLSPSVTKEDLEIHFSPHGKLKDVRLATYKNGNSKGWAYVEYQAEEAASRAVLLMDGKTIGDSLISVAISNPPPRNAPQSRQACQPERESKFVPTLGGGTRDNRNAAARTQLALVPRSLQRMTEKNGSTSAASKDAAVNNGGSEDKPSLHMSNKDFREMLLKK